jgi:hypothetical protein
MPEREPRRESRREFRRESRRESLRAISWPTDAERLDERIGHGRLVGVLERRDVVVHSSPGKHHECGAQHRRLWLPPVYLRKWANREAPMAGFAIRGRELVVYLAADLISLRGPRGCIGNSV